MFWLLLPTFAAAGFFSDHFAKYVNSSIQPCDDFYDHVCSAAVNDGNFFGRKGAERLQKVLRQIAAPEVRSFRAEIKNITDNLPDKPMGNEDIEAFNQFVGTTFTGCSYEFLKKLKYFDFIDGFEAYDGFTRLKNTPHYNTLKKKMIDIYALMKNILIKEFEQAPWTRRYPEMAELLKSIELTFFESEDLQLEKEIQPLKQRYEECLGITPNLTQALSKKCIEYVMCSNKYLFFKIYTFMSFAFTDDAQNWMNKITLSLMYYTLEEEDLAYMLGAVDFTISHELGHVFFNTVGALPSNFECFRDHIYNTCDTYLTNKTECEYYTNSYCGVRFGDDACDWIGVYGGLKALRHYFPKVFSDVSLANCKPEATEIMKKFFYANAINWCSETPGKGNSHHSPRKIRVNGILSLFPEFTEVFQCNTKSKMTKGYTCLPFAGPGAPETKRLKFGH